MLDTWFDARCGQANNPPVTCLPTDAIAAVNLARLTGETCMPPSALYECAILPTRELLDGVVRTASDLERCLEARKHLLHDYFVAALRVMVPVVSTQCATPLECLDYFNDKAEMFKNPQRTWLCRYDALSANAAEIFATFEPLCEACVKMVEARHRAERWDIWFRLLGYLGIVVADWVPPVVYD